MKYAVFFIKGFQYLVKEGQTIDVLGDFKKVPDIKMLFYSDGVNIEISDDKLKKVKFVVSIVKSGFKGKKIDVFKYKSKSRYRKHIGYRPVYTSLLVEKIGI